MMSLHYGILQSVYWMMFAAVNGFVTVYLLAQGLSESLIGLLIAISNILAAILQPVVAGWIDRSVRWRLKDIGLMLTGAIGATLLLGSLIRVLAIPAFLIAIILIWTLLPITNSIAVYYLDRGEKLNFGFTRAAGSGFFALMSFVIGYLVKLYGVQVIPISGFVMTVALAVTFALFKMDHRQDSNNDPYKYVQSSTNFLQEHKPFLIFLIGIILLFTFHTFATTYLIHIVRRIGGDEATMGTAAAVMALAEIPVLMISDKLLKHFGAKKLLIIAGLFWVVKAIGVWLAPNVPLFYLVMLTQAISYAPLIPGSIYYTNSIMKEREKVLGQALVTSSFTIGGVIGSLIGGFIIGYFGVPHLLVAGVIITALGALIIMSALGMQKET